MKDQPKHSMLCDHGKWFGWKCIKGLKDPLKGFLWLVMFWIWILVGSVFLIVLVSEVCSNMVIGVNERCFSLRIMIWHLTSYEFNKNGKKKFLQVAGGTLTIHRRNPVLGSAWSVGPILEYTENTLAEPNFGIRLIRQCCKSRQSVFLTSETILKIFKNS